MASTVESFQIYLTIVGKEWLRLDHHSCQPDAGNELMWNVTMSKNYVSPLDIRQLQGVKVCTLLPVTVVFWSTSPYLGKAADRCLSLN